MRQTELILFVVVMLINGGIALYKKHKQREAERAAKSLGNLATSARAEAKAMRPKRTPAPAPAKPVAARPAPAPAPARPIAPPAGPAPDRAKPVALPPAPVFVPAIARAARARPGAGVGAVNVARGRVELGSRRALRDAVIASEVLGRPRADRPFGA